MTQNDRQQDSSDVFVGQGIDMIPVGTSSSPRGTMSPSCRNGSVVFGTGTKERKKPGSRIRATRLDGILAKNRGTGER